MTQIGIKQAAMYNIIAKFSVMFIQLVLNMILARLIEPAAFGIISVITVLINFFNLFADMGIAVSVIQNKELTKKEHEQLFTFSFYVGLILSVVIVAISYPVSLIYDNEMYLILCPCICVVAIANSLNAVPNALLSRDKRFDIIALRNVICNLISGAITVVLALLGWGIYALLIHSILSSVSVFLWNYLRSRLSFKFILDKKLLVNCLGKYSLFQFLFSIVNYLTRNLDNLIVGAKMGDEQLGYYNKAYTLNLYPNTLFTNVISSVLHPYIRDYKNNLDELYDKIIHIIKPLSLLAIFIQLIFYWCPSEIIMIMYGPQWDVAAVCFKWLSLCVWAQMLSSVCGAVFLGLQRTDQTFKCGIINIILIATSVFVGVSSDLKTLSTLIGVAYILIFAITYYILVVQTMHLSIKPLIKALLPDALAIAVFTVVITFVPDYFTNIWISLITKTAIVGAYGFVYIFATGQHDLLFSLVKSFAKKEKNGEFSS